MAEVITLNMAGYLPPISWWDFFQRHGKRGTREKTWKMKERGKMEVRCMGEGENWKMEVRRRPGI